MRFFLFAPVFFLLSLGLVFAQSDTEDFNIRVLGDVDLTPPSTPTLLSADPVSISQIDLTWTASTDNFLVGGYVIQRDGTPIATTTLLNYSDTGLSSSTTYEYAVTAFDHAFIYSTTSNSISTTTLSPPVDPPVATTSDSSGTAAKVVLKKLSIESGYSTTSFAVETAHPARLEIRWGKTDAYELGYIVGGVYRISNIFSIDGLEPGTTYEYEIVGYSAFGLPFILDKGSFTTIEYGSILSPMNVIRFQALANGESVALRWQLPSMDKISHVRVVRSHLGFPSNPNDGAIVYQGLGTEASDVDILKQYSPVYYTAFVYDSYGNISSGAVAKVYSSEINNDSPNDGFVSEPVVLINEERVTPEMKMPEIADILLTQLNGEFSLAEAPLKLSSAQPFTILVPVESVSKNLKSIIVSIIDPTDNRQTYSFLLKINKDRSAYEATVAPLLVLGRSQIVVEIYDYESYVVATYKAPILFVADNAEGNSKNVFLDTIIKHLYKLLIGFLLLVIVVSGLIFLRRRKTEDNTGLK